MTSPYDRAQYDPLDTFAAEALSVTSAAAVGFTTGTMEPSGVTFPSGPAKAAYVQCQVAAVRYRTDGTDPTATVGKLLNPGDQLTVWGRNDLKSIRFIAVGSTATLFTEYAR